METFIREECNTTEIETTTTRQNIVATVGNVRTTSWMDGEVPMQMEAMTEKLRKELIMNLDTMAWLILTHAQATSNYYDDVMTENPNNPVNKKRAPMKTPARPVSSMDDVRSDPLLLQILNAKPLQQEQFNAFQLPPTPSLRKTDF